MHEAETPSAPRRGRTVACTLHAQALASRRAHLVQECNGLAEPRRLAGMNRLADLWSLGNHVR